MREKPSPLSPVTCRMLAYHSLSIVRHPSPTTRRPPPVFTSRSSSVPPMFLTYWRQFRLQWRQINLSQLREDIVLWRQMVSVSISFWAPEPPNLCNNSLIMHPMVTKMVSCLSGTISKHHAKFQIKRFSGCREKRLHHFLDFNDVR